MQDNDEIIQWLLEGDPAVCWQVQRDLLGATPNVYQSEQARTTREGWGARFLSLQDPEGTWGGGLYSPKWISTTYTMLTLRYLGLPAETPQMLRGCELLLENGYRPLDQGVNFAKSWDRGEACVSGMVLSLLAYVNYPDERTHKIVEYLFNEQMADGGWNCEAHLGATHSSFHTTISALEGLHEYEKAYPEHAAPVREAQAQAREFLLQHYLYRSHRTGEIVNDRMTRFPFPPRWFYDVLRALDYFQAVDAVRDERMEDAISLLMKRRRKDGRWPHYRGPSGRTFFEMEKAGQSGRMNTLRALRVLKWWHAPKSDLP